MILDRIGDFRHKRRVMAELRAKAARGGRAATLAEQLTMQAEKSAAQAERSAAQAEQLTMLAEQLAAQTKREAARADAAEREVAVLRRRLAELEGDAGGGGHKG